MEIPEFPYVREGGLAVLVCVVCGCAARAHPTVETLLPPQPHSTVETVAEVSNENLPVGVFHRVLPGQTLWRIARTYGMELQELVEANSILDATKISVGDMIWIPGAPTELDVTIVASQALPVAEQGDWLWPVPGGSLLSAFGTPRHNHNHGGLDIGAAAGQPVVSARHGRVVYSDGRLRGYGKTIIVDHGDGLQSLYAHNSELLVRVGDHVRQGQPIARVGRTGNATANHLHFEIRVNDRQVDPARWVQDEKGARQ